jgi:methionine-rich copper-binding protein CopC
MFLAAVVVATPAPGRADDGALVSAVPADGAAVADAPSAVRLTFNRAPDVARSHVGVADDTSALLGTGGLTLDGRSLRQPVRSAARGTVVVAYHVEFADGTEVTGSIRFSVGTGVPPAPAAGEAQRAAESAADAGHGHGIDTLSAVLLVVDLGVLLVVLALLMLRPRRHVEDDDHDGDGGGPDDDGESGDDGDRALTGTG